MCEFPLNESILPPDFYLPNDKDDHAYVYYPGIPNQR